MSAPTNRGRAGLNRVALAACLSFGGAAMPGLAAALATAGAPEPWFAPARAAKKRNPVAADAQSVATGKKLYERDCLSCHGATGAGDGPQATGLDRSPGNLADPAQWDESDGALFWKITEGKAPMPAEKTLMTDEERWHVVNYLRTLAPKPQITPPKFEAPEGHRRALSAVLQAYFQLHAALVGRDAAGAAKAAAAVSEATARLRDLDPGVFKDAAAQGWQASLEALIADASAAESAPDERGRIDAFRRLSRSLHEAIAGFGHNEQRPVLLFAAGSSSSRDVPIWLQAEPKPLNPYDAGPSAPAPVLRARLGPTHQP